MSEETLLTAARRVVRFIRIDEADGGLLSLESVKAAMTLSRQVDLETARLKREAPNDLQIKCE